VQNANGVFLQSDWSATSKWRVFSWQPNGLADDKIARGNMSQGQKMIDNSKHPSTATHGVIMCVFV